MNRIITQEGPVYQATTFAEIGWIEHGFGTRGVLLDDYLVHFGLKGASAARTNQIHGNRVHVLTPTPLVGEGRGEGVLEGDAFVTASKNVVCFVRTADCVPVLLCDPLNRAVGSVHAGWRGQVCDVIGSTIRVMQKQFGSDAAKIIAAIGPSICPACYTVGEEVIKEFSRNGFDSSLWIEQPDKKGFSLNLRGTTQKLLISSGVRPENISLLPLCTFCHIDDFASYRRERAEKSRQVNFICIR